MKYNILMVLIIFSCKEVNLDSIQAIDNSPFYDIILNELEKVDTSKYYIIYNIKEDISIPTEIYESIEKTHVLSSQEIKKLKDKLLFKNFDTELSIKKKEIITFSKEGIKNKIEINYLFSYPYLINENKVLIFNFIKFMNPISHDVKGGSERAIILTKKEGDWEILKIINLIEI